jgi:hypothetical protein
MLKICLREYVVDDSALLTARCRRTTVLSNFTDGPTRTMVRMSIRLVCHVFLIIRSFLVFIFSTPDGTGGRKPAPVKYVSCFDEDSRLGPVRSMLLRSRT